MGSSVIGDLLILFLLIVNCSRMFFLKYGKVDSLTILAPICLILSVLQILAWKASLFSIALLIISIFAFCTNFRALLRFCSGLYVDHYRVAFKIGATLVLIACAAEVFFLIYFFPIQMIPSRFGVNEEKIRLSGSFQHGFEKSEIFRTSDAIIYKYEVQDKTKQKKEKIILISDKRADSEGYIPFMILLSQKGYTVYSGDFYSNDLRWIHNSSDSRYLRRLSMLYKYLKNPVQFNAQKEFYSYNSKKEIEQMINFVKNDVFSEQDEIQNQNENKDEKSEINNSSIYIISDWMSEIAAEDFYKQNESEIGGIINLSKIEEYKTCGFGFVQLTFPLDAYLLGFPKEKNLESVERSVEETVKFLPESEAETKTESETTENAENIETNEDDLK